MRAMRWMIAGSVVVAMLFTAWMAVAQDDIAKHPSCKYCGMDRKMFSHSRMLVTYDDGSQVGTCSVHCMAVDQALHIDKSPRTIQVGDYRTKALIDAETATWVLGGSKPGVMTKRAKWAFAGRADAEAFVKENGGSLTNLDQALRASYEDMHSDTMMIRDKRKRSMQKPMQGPMHKH